MMLLKKLYPQFQPKRAFEVVAVVEAYRKTPVRTVEEARAPFRPNLGISTNAPPSNAPGTPKTAMMRELR
jgi:hypothetical protein